MTPDASLAHAAAELRDRGVGALVVSSDGRTLEGILSERDVVRALAAHGASALGRTVSSTMSANVVTCAAQDSVESLMAAMTERRIRHLPVVDADGALAGIVSIGDVVKLRLGATGEREPGPARVRAPGALTRQALPGGRAGRRSPDPTLFRRVLCRLSYSTVWPGESAPKTIQRSRRDSNPRPPA